MGNGIPCLLLGIPLLRFATPLVVDSPFFCSSWWGGGRPIGGPELKLRNWPVAARLLLAFGAAGVLPMMAVSAVDVSLSPFAGPPGAQSR